MRFYVWIHRRSSNAVLIEAPTAMHAREIAASRLAKPADLRAQPEHFGHPITRPAERPRAPGKGDRCENCADPIDPRNYATDRQGFVCLPCHDDRRPSGCEGFD